MFYDCVDVHLKAHIPKHKFHLWQSFSQNESLVPVKTNAAVDDALLILRDYTMAHLACGCAPLIGSIWGQRRARCCFLVPFRQKSPGNRLSTCHSVSHEAKTMHDSDRCPQRDMA